MNDLKENIRFGKLGQVTIFVILAIVIIGVVILFFAFRSNLFGERIPEEFQPIYAVYDGCVEQETRNALDILGSQGGRINVGDIEPGSDFSPFSSHLNFLGFQIPYWYYISGNNLITEKIPSGSDMEKDVEEYLTERINDCDFQEFYSQGYYIEIDEPSVDVVINENEVRVEVNADLVSQIEDRSAKRGNHKIAISSKIGRFYEMSKDIYNKEINEQFLENYAVDVLHNYAPVDGVEIQCSPKIWKTPEVVKEIKDGLQANIGAIKIKGSYYRLDENEDDYFVQELRDYGRSGVDDPVNFIYLGDGFPSKVEVTPASQAIMVSEPVGNQEGLGVMGFCYVPYHFIYDLSFPVLVQISDGVEIFQFPISVVVDNNFPSRDTGTVELGEFTTLANSNNVDICEFAEGEVEIKTFDSNLNPVESDIAYNCFDSFCELGKTEISGVDSVLQGDIPVCLNGFLIAKAEGFAEKRTLFSSNKESFVEIFLDKEYEVEVELKIAGRELKNGETAVVHFVGEEYSSSAILPEVDKLKLIEGMYDVSVYVYGGSNVRIPATRKTECFETARGGIAGFFGGTKEKCVDVEFPELNIDQALNGGGKASNYILESDLQDRKIIIDVNELPKPNSLEQLQYNHEVFDSLGVFVS